MSDAEPKHPIETTVDAYITDIESVRASAPILATVMFAARASAHKKHYEFLEAKCEQSTNGDRVLFTIPGEYYHEHVSLEHIASRTDRAFELVPRSFLVSLVSQYDFFLSRLVADLFSLRPDTLKSCERTLTYSDLCCMGSVEEARKAIVGDEIETLLRKSHEEQFDWLEKKFAICLRKGLSVWPIFIELTERRNLFVHTDGVVSKQYINKCGLAGCKIGADLVPGKKLVVSLKYVQRACDALYEIGVKLSQVLWRKLDSGSIEKADDALNSVGFNLLNQKRYKIAQTIFDFASSLPRFSSEKAKFYFLVNRANAYKLAGDQGRCSEIIKGPDWSALSVQFQLAEAILSDNVTRACDLMKRIGTSGEISKGAYRDWPLFESVRQNENFQSTFRELFREPYFIEETVKQPRKMPELVEHPQNPVPPGAPS